MNVKKLLAVIIASMFLGGAINSFAQQTKPIVIVEKNMVQSSGQWVRGTANEYQGDKELLNAFQTVQVRLARLLDNSGRVKVRPFPSAADSFVEDNVYLCSYDLLQGRQTGRKRGMLKEYIVEIGMMAWNYKDSTSLSELSRSRRVQDYFESPEDAIEFVVRYLALTTLETISPITITEKEDTAIAVNAGGELLKNGDKLQVRKGLTGKVLVTVDVTEGTRSICVVDPSDVDNVAVGAKVIYRLPEDEYKVAEGNTTVVIRPVKMNLPPAYTISVFRVVVDDTPIASAPVANSPGANINLGLDIARAVAPGQIARFIPTVIPGQAPPPRHNTPPRPLRHVTVNDTSQSGKFTSGVLVAKIKTQDLGLAVLDFDGVSYAEDRQSDYELICEINGYAESHENGSISNGMLTFDQKGVLSATVTLRNCKTLNVVGGKVIPITAVCVRQGSISALAGTSSASSLLAWDEVCTAVAVEVAKEIRSIAASIKK